MQQGFATAEPFIYENEIAQWKKPIAFEVFANYGYSIYPEPLAVRADKVAALTPCLKKLVPIMQRAQIDFLKNPAPTNDLIVKLVDQYQTGWTYTPGDADFSVKTQVEGKFVTNDPASGVFGKFDPKRMSDTVAPLRAAAAVRGHAHRHRARGREPLHQPVHRRFDQDVSTATEKACAEITRLGAGSVTFDEAQRTKASSDWSRMSPILAEKVPAGRYVADAVVRPATDRDVATVLRVAYEHDVPVTPRGAGTGNYGQATPFEGGILLDLRALTDVRIGADTVTAGAGARLSAIDKELRAAGRDIWMYPSTKTSTIGGFVGGGSAGTGSIEHLTTSDGYVVSRRSRRWTARGSCSRSRATTSCRSSTPTG